MATRYAVGRLTVVIYGFLACVGTLAQAGPLRPADLSAEAAALVSHEAVYDMRLAAVRSAAGVVGAGGTMNYTFTNGCDGWTVETRTDLTMLETQGGPVQTSWDFLSWEDKSGKAYRFRVRNLRNGQVVEAYDGEARMGDNGQGTATFHFPDDDDQTFPLPHGSMFPTSHTVELLRRARKGARFYAAPVFDGSAVQGAFQVSAGLAAAGKGAATAQAPDKPADKPAEGTADKGASDKGASDKGNPDKGSPDKGSPEKGKDRAGDKPVIDLSLLQSPAWPMTLAFFDMEGNGDTPDFEVTLRYHENGVAEDIFQDFGDFALRGTLNTLKPLKKPDC